MPTPRARHIVSALVLLTALASPTVVRAQRGGGGGPAAPAPPARSVAPKDLTGTWVSVVAEHWHLRMLVPPKGEFAMLPLNPEARRMAGAWDPAKEPAGDAQCKGYGAAAINPIRALTGILGAMHDAKGRVTIPGFYDDIVEPPASQLEGWRQLGFDEGAFLGGIGLATPAGETGRSVLEQIWARPTAEVNGIHGGYTGPGTKTVIPAQAAAKLSFRLVPGMDPDGVLDRFDAFVRANLHVECRYELHHRHGSPAVGFDTSSPAMTAAAGALQAEWGEAPALIGSGGSIPVVGLMKTVLDMDSLLVGFALDDDRIHSPNEKYNVRSFEQGARSWVRILGALSALGRLAKARPSGGMR